MLFSNSWVTKQSNERYKTFVIKCKTTRTTVENKEKKNSTQPRIFAGVKKTPQGRGKFLFALNYWVFKGKLNKCLPFLVFVTKMDQNGTKCCFAHQDMSYMVNRVYHMYC